jgi:hypothetical protein
LGLVIAYPVNSGSHSWYREVFDSISIQNEAGTTLEAARRRNLIASAGPRTQKSQMFRKKKNQVPTKTNGAEKFPLTQKFIASPSRGASWQPRSSTSHPTNPSRNSALAETHPLLFWNSS